tara:strand:- start:251 stop:562 length:312 start_codon:yes stop_codon:yes gene_type:complete
MRHHLKKENKMINYVAAYNGGIKMHYGETRGSKGQYQDFVFATTPGEVAGFMNELGLAETIMGSSNMDFATESGFDTDDGAQLLLKRAFELVYVLLPCVYYQN